jgi:hypothetical protein
MANRYIQRFEDIEVTLPTPGVNRLGGIFRMEAYKCREMRDGRSIEIPGTRRLCGEFPNVITNTGLDHIGNKAAYSAYLHVGTGGAAESEFDNTLDTFVASQLKDSSYAGNVGGYLWWSQQSAPYYGSCQVKYRCPPNKFGGAINVAELGLSTQPTTGNLFCRALVKSGGVPTVAPVAVDEYFDVYYTLRNYGGHFDYTDGSLSDGSGSITIGGTSYNYTIRVASILNNTFWARNLFSGFSTAYTPGFYERAYYYAPTVTMGNIFSFPTSDTASTYHSYTWVNGTGTYTNSTYTNSMDYQLDLDEGNLTGGIRGFAGLSTLGAYQWILDGAVPKDNTKVMNWSFQQSWDRHAL